MLYNNTSHKIKTSNDNTQQVADDIEVLQLNENIQNQNLDISIINTSKHIISLESAWTLAEQIGAIWQVSISKQIKIPMSLLPSSKALFLYDASIGANIINNTFYYQVLDAIDGQDLSTQTCNVIVQIGAIGDGTLPIVKMILKIYNPRYYL